MGHLTFKLFLASNSFSKLGHIFLFWVPTPSPTAKALPPLRGGMEIFFVFEGRKT